MLLPATRGNIQNVNEFLSEAKMTAMMEHPRVISFVGVAWDSLSDLCVVLEFMDGGDLRTLLDKYISEARPVGFTRVKATIALHVCHALVYLHSLDPAIIHRDLKSRNVLLNHAMEAKLTDFGISRERLDRTMTANVGTKLWMAPEVMMGDKYDEKADMFSFGVLLSELDLHTLPYAFAKAEGSGNPQLSDTAILQKVALGALRVDFSGEGSPSMAELGCACVSVDPRQRPSAAEVLYRLQLALTHEVC
jgi:serine/threonine-protein kinase TNNI3K